MNPARRGSERTVMTATRTPRRISRRASRAQKVVARRGVKPTSKAPGKSVAGGVGKIGSKLAPPPQVLYRLCRPGWAVIVEKSPNAQGTRLVCPFCPLSHRVSGPVRGFRKLRRAQWVKLRRVEE